jgi:hypothetical protein
MEDVAKTLVQASIVLVLMIILVLVVSMSMTHVQQGLAAMGLHALIMALVTRAFAHTVTLVRLQIQLLRVHVYHIYSDSLPTIYSV